MLELEHIFASDGPLAREIDGYFPRASQVEMAEAVGQAIHDREHLIAEAGTGTGKTFAYLVPAILSGSKIIISTRTRNLQDQLFNKDIPVLRKALRVPLKVELLKGRSNYLCLYRLNNAIHAELGHTRKQAAELRRIQTWSRRTRRGDISELSGVSELSPVWAQATSTVDNCLGQDCPNYSECFAVNAKRKAQAAEILVINHHLLCAEWSLRGGGFGEILPDADVVIVDEAHHIEDTASQFLGLSLSARQLIELTNDIKLELDKDAADMESLMVDADQLADQVKNVRIAFGERQNRGAWNEISLNQGILSALRKLEDQLNAMTVALKQIAERGKGLDTCVRRAEEMLVRLRILLNDDEEHWIKWYETFKHSFVLTRTPMKIADEFQQFLHEFCSTWIFTSATLAVDRRFDHFSHSLGFNKVRTGCWDSPFDYASQALFYHPKNMPEPRTPNFVEAVIDAAVPVINASQGRTFLLFTSHKALQQATLLLEDRIEYPILVQGDHPKALLIDQFKSHGNAVLLGTSSFWEGVDVRGSALCCVIIDKLPFASPNDPVLKARLDSLNRQGQNSFVDHQLPAAVIALKQGVGRLIRDIHDRGVLMLCDPRLLNRSYGKVFLDSIPRMLRTQALTRVEAFFAAENPDETKRLENFGG